MYKQSINQSINQSIMSLTEWTYTSMHACIQECTQARTHARYACMHAATMNESMIEQIKVTVCVLFRTGWSGQRLGCHTFSAFWLWSSVVSVLISVTAGMSPTGDLHVTSIFLGEEVALSLLKHSCVLPWSGTMLGAARPLTLVSISWVLNVIVLIWNCVVSWKNGCIV
jgi:hypothetical protein